MIRPRPTPPYWPAYPEPERSRLEAEYREEERRWQREAMFTLTCNTILACLPMVGIAVAALIFIGTIPDIIRLLGAP